MTRDIELESSPCRALISPYRGGRLRSLRTHEGGRWLHWIKGLDVQGGGIMHGGGGPLLAAPSQVPEALQRHVPDPDALEQPWQVTGVSRRCAALTCRSSGVDGPGCNFQSHISYDLHPNRLEMRFSLRNLGREAMPLRLGWRLHLPDDFSHEVQLDERLPTLWRPPRGLSRQCEPWSGLATFRATDGRCLVLRSSAPIFALSMQRHESRPLMALAALTPDAPLAPPLARGDEYEVDLTIDLMRLPPPCPSVLSSGPMNAAP